MFPFGQIIKIGIFHPIDIIVGLASIHTLVRGLKKPAIFKNFIDLIFIFTGSYLMSAPFFFGEHFYTGFLYLIRLVAYFCFVVYLHNFVKNKSDNRSLLVKSLVSISIVSAIFGWIQYFTFPDIKPFFVFGWDEHLFRIVGTFFDPSFLALILVFGIIIAPNLLIRVFLTLTLAFTYSRAGYVAFFVAMVALIIYKKNIKESLICLLLLLFTIPLLPRPTGESVKLERTSSIYARFNNYQETLNIFKKNPVFGIGYNNLCLARQKYIGVESFSSHSCSGSESSLLFILATTGVLGLIALIKLGFHLWVDSGYFFKISSLALLTHSFFSNSIFYVWIIVWMLILFVSEKKLRE